MRKGDLIKEIDDCEIRKFFGLKLLVTDSFSEKAEKNAEREDVDMVIAKENAPEDYFYKCFKISYEMDLSQIQSADELLKSSRRRSIRKKKESLDIEIEERIRKESLEEWLKLYNKMIDDMAFGVKYLHEEWFLENNAVGVFAKFNGKIIGGIIISLKNGMPSLAYSSFDKDYRKKRPMEIMLYEFINWAKNRGFKKIRYGSDTNFYGYHLSTGLHLYKKSWGFIPKAGKRFEYLKIRKFDKLSKNVLFFSGEELTPVLIFKGGVDKELVKKVGGAAIYQLIENGPSRTRTCDLRAVNATS